MYKYIYSNSGGGGERVLWCAIKALEMSQGGGDDLSFKVECVVYSGDLDASKDDILLRVAKRFGIYFNNKMKIDIVYLRRRYLVEAYR